MQVGCGDHHHTIGRIPIASAATPAGTLHRQRHEEEPDAAGITFQQIAVTNAVINNIILACLKHFDKDPYMRACATTESLPLTLIFRSYVDCTVQAPSCSPVNNFLEIN